MDPTAWTVIGTGVVILIAIAGAFRALRNELRDQLREQRREFSERIDRQGKELGERIDALSAQMHRLEIELRERMAKVEGLLEGLREAIAGRRAA